MIMYILVALVVFMIIYSFVMTAKYHAQIKINDDLFVQIKLKEAEIVKSNAENQKLLEDIYNLQQKLKTQPDSEKPEEAKPTTKKTTTKKATTKKTTKKKEEKK